MTKIFVFPGQGIQKVGMGAKLFEKFPQIVAQIDDELGFSIRELCLEDPHKQLGQTQYTQLALYTVNALYYLELIEKHGKPDFVLGHSLGEYNALMVAQSFDLVTGLKLVKERGRLMNSVSGAMAAVIGLSQRQIEQILEENSFTEIDIANINSPQQIVIAGPHQDIATAQQVFLDNQASHYITLQVSGPFHSRYMTKAKEDFAAIIENFILSPPQIPVISNFTGTPYGENVSENLVAQIASPVQWLKSIEYLLKQPFQYIVKNLKFGFD